jgi:endonuclease-3 related protein
VHDKEHLTLASTARILKDFHDALYAHFGPQEWWPAESPFEVMVGAILTQNTNWKNVEKAIANLKGAGLLNPHALRSTPLDRLAELIRPAGYYNVKAGRLMNLLAVLVDDYGGDLGALFDGRVSTLRERLLAIRGIGPETADSITLYAAGKPTFVVDAYTYRMAVRHGLILDDATYDEVKALFEENLPEDARLFNEYHALIVRVGKEFCKKTPACAGCPLESFPHEV